MRRHGTSSQHRVHAGSSAISHAEQIVRQREEALHAARAGHASAKGISSANKRLEKARAHLQDLQATHREPVVGFLPLSIRKVMPLSQIATNEWKLHTKLKLAHGNTSLTLVRNMRDSKRSFNCTPKTRRSGNRRKLLTAIWRKPIVTTKPCMRGSSIGMRRQSYIVPSSSRSSRPLHSADHDCVQEPASDSNVSAGARRRRKNGTKPNLIVRALPLQYERKERVRCLDSDLLADSRAALAAHEARQRRLRVREEHVKALEQAAQRSADPDLHERLDRERKKLQKLHAAHLAFSHGIEISYTLNFLRRRLMSLTARSRAVERVISSCGSRRAASIPAEAPRCVALSSLYPHQTCRRRRHS